ncbi:MAG: ABC transporter permease subunit [Acidobacteria bacterium]|nr:ABC transporter permease subunit [Acidobacteriota bacterium]
MRNILAVAGKELRSYFHSPIAYLVMAVYSVLCGFFFYSFTATYVVQTFRMQAMGGMGMPSMTINDYVIRPLFEGVLAIVLLLLIPLITMRLYAEEKRSGTIELLLTSPITDLQIILGKFLGALLLYGTMIVITFGYLGVLFIYGNPFAKPLIAQAVGLFLFGGALLALGMWISTFTKNQIIAAVVSFAVFLLFYVLNWVTAYSSGAVSRVLAYLSLTTHFDAFSKGVVDLKDLVYYLSVIVLGIFLTARSVEALKGRV